MKGPGELKVYVVMIFHHDLSQTNPHPASLPRCFTLLPSKIPDGLQNFRPNHWFKLSHSSHELSVSMLECHGRVRIGPEIGGQENIKWKLKLSLQSRVGVGLWPGLGIGDAAEVKGLTPNSRGEWGGLQRVCAVCLRSELTNSDEQVAPKSPALGGSSDPASNSSRSSGPLI